MQRVTHEVHLFTPSAPAHKRRRHGWKSPNSTVNTHTTNSRFDATINLDMDMANTLLFAPEAFEAFQLSQASDQAYDWFKPSQDLFPPITRGLDMSATQQLRDNWIRQLYVNESKSIEEVRERVNSLFNITEK
jgi:hypothetical protein